MSSTEIRVPDIGDFEDVEIIDVLVSPGDHVAEEAPLITLESDKATMDVPTPAAGIVQELKVQVGDKVSKGSPILILEEADRPAESPAREPPAAAATDKPVKPPEPEPPSAAAGSSPEPARQPAPEPAPPRDEPASQASEGKGEPAHAPPPTLPPPIEPGTGSVPHASPSIRHLARELGVDLNRVRGSGPKGRILKTDVQNFVKSELDRPAGVAGAPSLPAMPEIDFAQFGPVETGDVPRIKKLSGAHLQRAWATIPHVTHHEEADVTEMEDFRKSLKQDAERQGVRVTGLLFLMKAVVAALKEFPLFNTSLTADGQSLVYKRYYHIGIAVDTPRGLVVPVVRDVDKKGIWELAAELGDISERARDGKLKAEEMQGGCMSISNLGGIGGTAFTPIVNAPEVAILGAARSRMQPVWNGEAFEPRLMMPLDLSYDHRVIDGAEAARFARFLCEVLEDVRRMLL